MEPVSAQRRRDILDALRRGTVPARGLDLFAVGLGRFEPTLAAELDAAAAGGAVFQAVRGEYGAGKTFFARWVKAFARRRRFATAEVQVSETEPHLHRLQTVHRRAMERLATADTPADASRSVIDGWFYGLEEEVLAVGGFPPLSPPGGYRLGAGPRVPVRTRPRGRRPRCDLACVASGASRPPVVGFAPGHRPRFPQGC
jgi:hypothetical protein